MRILIPRSQDTPKTARDAVVQRRRIGATLAPPDCGIGWLDRGALGRAASDLAPGLRAGIEALAGVALPRVAVHRHSPEPARIGARAFARGGEIHLGPGQDRHLLHEAWHLAQQAQGRVAPTGRLGGTAVNDDPALEREADTMGARAAAIGQVRAPTTPPRAAAVDGAPVMQRYLDRADEARHEKLSPEVIEWAQRFQRRSADGGFGQVSEKELYARDDLIESSEKALRNQGSFIELVAGEQLSPGYHRVKVRCRDTIYATAKKAPDLEGLATESARPAQERQAKQVEVIDALLKRNLGNIGSPEASEQIKEGSADANRSMRSERESLVAMKHPDAEDMFMTIRDCHKTARLIMGDFGNREEKIVFSDAQGTLKKLVPASSDREIFATIGQLGAVGFLKYAFSAFGGVLAKLPERDPELEKRVTEVAKSWKYPVAMNVYEAIQKHPTAGPLFNRTFQVNDEARVAVGQALVQVNDEHERQASVSGTLIDKSTGKKKDLWNFHWAGVVMVDGDDCVTLQAVADQMASDLTVNWWFKIYGRGAQSFHAEEKNDPHVGSRPLTLGVATESRGGGARKVVKPLADQ